MIKKTALNILVGIALMLSFLSNSCTNYLSQKYSSEILFPHQEYFVEPTASGMPFEKIEFKNVEGHTLRGWFICRQNADATVMICCGNTGNISYHLLYAEFLYEAGFNVFLFDYQGFGKSEGKESMKNLTSDCVNAFEYLTARQDIDPQRVGVFGISLGSILALATAAETQGVKAVVAEAIFEPEKEFYKQIDQECAKVFAYIVTKFLVWFGFPYGFDPHDSLDEIQEVPVFFIHGEEDDLLRPSAALRCFMSTKGPKRIWILSNTGHAPETMVTHDRDYQWQIVNFFKKWLSKQAPEFPSVKIVEWKVVEQSDKGYSVRVKVEAEECKDEIPCEILLVSKGNWKFHRFRRWLSKGKKIFIFEVPNKPSFVVVTPYHHVERKGNKWERKISNYAQSYNLLKQTRKKVWHEKTEDGLAAIEKIDFDLMDERIQPQFASLYYTLGKSFEKSDRIKQAIHCFKKSVLLSPKNSNTYYTLGDASFSFGPPYACTRAYYDLERIYDRLGKDKKELEQLKKRSGK